MIRGRRQGEGCAAGLVYICLCLPCLHLSLFNVKSYTGSMKNAVLTSFAPKLNFLKIFLNFHASELYSRCCRTNLCHFHAYENESTFGHELNLN